MKKSKLLLPLTAITALGAITPMVAMTSCATKKKAASDFVNDSWTDLIANCSTPKKFYNAYIKLSSDPDIESDEEAVTKIREAIVESASSIVDPTTQTYRFERTIPILTEIGKADVKIRLVAVGQDQAVDSAKAYTFTFEFVDCVQLLAFDTTVKNWAYKSEGSETFDQSADVRSYLQNIFPQRLPQEVQKAIVTVSKETNLGVGSEKDPQTLPETFYLIDENEMGINPGTVSEYKPSDKTFSFYSKLATPEGKASPLYNPIYLKTYFGIEDTPLEYWTRIKRGDADMTYIFKNDHIIETARYRGYGVCPIFNI